MNPGITSSSNQETDKKLVFTIKERCRVCYTCVRECPAKAIRIAGGQAGVITARCIACGNCIKVCSQEAKIVYKEIEQVKKDWNIINTKMGTYENMLRYLYKIDNPKDAFDYCKKHGIIEDRNKEY